MTAIPVQKLIDMFQAMYIEHWSYIWGKAEKGCVDCSGAFVYAYKQYGRSISHGSNAIARKYTIGKMLPIAEAKPGMAAFKTKLPNESGYALPEKYMDSNDKSDYYHIGLVDSDGKHVLNAKGEKAGFCRDDLTRQSSWDCVAYLKDVEYGEDVVPVAEIAKVVLPAGASGTTVNLRKDGTKTADIIARVPVGAEVRVINDLGTWCCIGWGDKTGYMMSNYLEYEGQDGESESLTDSDREQIESALKAIEQATETIGSILGRG